MSTQSKFGTSADAKKAGWFSRRYKTQSDSAAAREAFEAPRREEARRLLKGPFQPMSWRAK